MIYRRVAIVAGCVSVLAVHLIGLLLDFLATMATGPLTDMPRVSGHGCSTSIRSWL